MLNKIKSFLRSFLGLNFIEKTIKEAELVTNKADIDKYTIDFEYVRRRLSDKSYHDFINMSDSEQLEIYRMLTQSRRRL